MIKQAEKVIEGIEVGNVTKWFVEKVPDISTPLTFQLITGGQSNLTFRVADKNGKCFVLRRPPLGQVLESAHDMGREYRIISSLAPTDIPVPHTFGICRDQAVNGADFYVMHFVDGIVHNDSVSAAKIPEQARMSLGFDIMDVLIKLHNIDPDNVGLGNLGKKQEYVGRQVKRWTKQWEKSKTEDIPEIDQITDLLKKNVPVQQGAVIAHGDYRPGNLIVSDNRVAAVLDWELCTLGDPLADVGYLLNWWSTPEEVELGPGDNAPTAVGGFPGRDELVTRYEKSTGRDLSDIDYYRSLLYWRLAVIYQGVCKRYSKGAMGAGNNFSMTTAKANIQKLIKNALDLLNK